MAAQGIEGGKMKTLYLKAIVECDNCGAKYCLHDDNTPKLPKLHNVCTTCFLPMETINPLYKYLKEYK